jgi:hypothetical protein
MENSTEKATTNEKVVVAKKEKLVKVRALNQLAGKFLLPYSEGDEFEINATQAAEIVESKNGEYITD